MANGFSSPSSPWALAILFGAVLLMFADVFLGEGKILSSSQADIASQFFYWRDFGFGELKKGNLALWNPHLFSGTPFLGGFQAALLYPLNLPYLFLPLETAINVGIVLHVFLLGFFMYLWARHRGLHPLASLLTGILILFCGPHFLHIYAGHLPNLCAMVWVPLIFLALDGLLVRPSLGYVLLGIVAFAMHILAGHPQYVYYTGLAILVYLPAALLAPVPSQTQTESRGENIEQPPSRPRSLIRNWRRSLPALCIMFGGGLALSAVQFLTGLDAAGESVRTGGVSFSFASMFSFPPENLLTAIVPYFFGGMIGMPYWGRAYLWEMNLFFSINGLLLAVYGLKAGGRTGRLLAGVAAALMILALGAHTPLFRVLYDYLPGFDTFRGTSKFIFYAVLFMIMLAGMGLDALLKKDGRIKKRPAADPAFLAILFFALLAAGTAIWLKLVATGSLCVQHWQSFLLGIAATGESYLNAAWYSHDALARQAAFFASSGLFIAAGTLFLAALLWRLARKYPRAAAYGMVLAAFLEVFLFAHITRVTFDPGQARMPALKQFLATTKDDVRVLNLWRPNSAMSLNAMDLWGYDPGVLRRYAELIAYTQGYDPQKAAQYVQFRNYHPLMGMLRLRYLITPEDGKLAIQEFPNAMSRLNLVSRWQVITQGGEILEAMGKATFNPRQTVILEKPPHWRDTICAVSSPASARIVSASTDEMTIDASLSCPAILLITDNFSKGWRAEPVRQEGQGRYEIIRANYTLMAVPLEAGHHLFRIVYRPWAFAVGAVTSLIGLVSFCAALLYWMKRRRPHLPGPPPRGDS